MKKGKLIKFSLSELLILILLLLLFSLASLLLLLSQLFKCGLLF